MSLRRMFEGVECARFGDEPVTQDSVTSKPCNARVTPDAVTRLEAENAALKLQVARLTNQLAGMSVRPISATVPNGDGKRAKTAARVAAHRKRQREGK